MQIEGGKPATREKRKLELTNAEVSIQFSRSSVAPRRSSGSFLLIALILFFLPFILFLPPPFPSSFISLWLEETAGRGRCQTVFVVASLFNTRCSLVLRAIVNIFK